MIRRAVRITNHTFGPAHPHTLHHRNLEAQTLWHLEKSAEAATIFQEVLQEYTKFFSQDHRKTLRTKQFLGETLNDLGKYDEAERHFLQLIETSRQDLERDNAMIVGAMLSLSTTLALQGRKKDARELNAKFMRLSQTFNTRYRLAKSYVLLQDYLLAEEICLSMLDDSEALQRDEFVSTDRIWHLLGKIYRKQKLFDKAEKVLLEAVPYRQKVYGGYSRVWQSHILSSVCFLQYWRQG